MNLPSLGFLAFIHQGRFVKEGLLPHAMEYRVHTVFKNLKLPATRNGNGEIDFEEFVQVMCRKVNTDYTADEVRKAFKAALPTCKLPRAKFASFDVFSGNAPDGCIRVKDLEQALQA
ncbi:unnamed protein product, partial [Durusdinium trenchii]